MNGPRWYDSAEKQLCEALESGEITDAEFDLEMRNLNDELRGAAEEAAEAAYNDVYGCW